jgi:hypothetical protein
MKFPWILFLYSMIGGIALRFVYTDDLEYLGACFIYAVVLGCISAAIQIGPKDE